MSGAPARARTLVRVRASARVCGMREGAAQHVGVLTPRVRVLEQPDPCTAQGRSVLRAPLGVRSGSIPQASRSRAKDACSTVLKRTQTTHAAHKHTDKQTNTSARAHTPARRCTHAAGPTILGERVLIEVNQPCTKASSSTGHVGRHPPPRHCCHVPLRRETVRPFRMLPHVRSARRHAPVRLFRPPLATNGETLPERLEHRSRTLPYAGVGTTHPFRSAAPH
jgi:hypothetical protein